MARRFGRPCSRSKTDSPGDDAIFAVHSFGTRKWQITKIKSTLSNTDPSWETHLAQAVTIQLSAEATMAVRKANDMTDELLMSNATNLRFANKVTRTEIEHGVFDIEAIKKANANLIGTIEESFYIPDEDKRKRAEAEKELKTWKLN